MQALLFYRTGQLAYVSQLEWERYDRQFRLKDRSAKVRAAVQRVRSEVGTRLDFVEKKMGLGRRLGQGWEEAARLWGQLAGTGGEGERGGEGGRRRQPTGAYSPYDVLLRPLSLLRQSRQALSRRLGPYVSAAAVAAAATAARISDAALGGGARQGDSPSLRSVLSDLAAYEWRYSGVVGEWARSAARRTRQLLGMKEQARRVNIWAGPFGAYVVSGKRREDKKAVERVLGWVGFERRGGRERAGRGRARARAW